MGDDRWTSAVWTYFERSETKTVVNGEERVEKFSQCTICGHRLRGHAASNNKRHLSTIHGIEEPEAQDEDRRQAKPGKPEQLFLQWEQLHIRVSFSRYFTYPASSNKETEDTRRTCCQW